MKSIPYSPDARIILMRRARWLSAGRRLRKKLPALFFLTDSARTPKPLEPVKRLPPGTGVIFRHYGAPDRLALARSLKISCRKRGLVFLVAGDARMAARVRADGVHMPEVWIDRLKPLKRARPGWILTASTHGREGLLRAANAGADAAFISPVFATKSHPHARSLGTVRLAALCRDAGLPAFALGGVNTASISLIKESGAAGIGAIDAFDVFFT